ncbi:MAG TPA: YndJ family transporter [Polyangiaceae bacterium]|mgnify:CR=1 FL=1|nr:YndJ family transporter [Polyangiaceae bacterium]
MHTERIIEGAVLFGLLWVYPVGLRACALAAVKREAWLARRARITVWAAGAINALSFALPGVFALRQLGAAAFSVFALLCVWLAGLRVVRRRSLRPEDFLLDYALVTPPVAALWLWVYQLELSFRGFSGLWAVLTLAHFIFAGFGTLTLVAMLARAQPANGKLRQALTLVAVLLGLGLPVLALGIDGRPDLERVGVGTYGLALPLLAVIQGSTAWRSRRVSGLRRAALGLSALTVVCTAVLAVGYGLLRLPSLSIPRMVHLHGLANAFGFVGLGLWALSSWHDAAPAKE